MIVQKWILKISNTWKPFLKRIVPVAVLRKCKKRLEERGLSQLKKHQREPFLPEKFPKGVNLIGNIRAEIGLGQSCRLVARELEQSGLPFSVLNFELKGKVRNQDFTYEHKITEQAEYGINLIHIHPYEMPEAYLYFDKEVWDSHYNIGFWVWELEELPEEWTECISLFDEIWTPSEFAARAMRKKISLPVYSIPFAVSAKTDENYNREYFGLPDNQFLYLIMYDSNSTADRKNPKGAVEAFKTAFPEHNSGAGLVIKVNNGTQEDLKELKEELKDYDAVYYITEVLDKIQVNSLLKCADVFVSLHCAEGFGLVMAEAMLTGTPVIATNWSANTEFMNSEVACMVDFEFEQIQKDAGHYKRGQRWARADIGQAAEYMIKLKDNSEFYQVLSRKAQKHIKENLSMEKAVSKIMDRVSKIYMS